ncbi:hypothetical protein [Serratia liquefaciens]|uniref:hypothetical protein n=1 Tax=Serratia liquefaciens TaxID=614 RepID=UPI0028BE05E0|nr:hypothetical protein [Serratia liquefaciens]
MSEELGWDVEAFDLALGEALSLGMVKADTQARVFWLPNAAKHNPPTSVNVIKSWVRAFELLPECNLKYEALESLRAASHGVSAAMGLAFDKAFALANPLAKDKAKPLPRPFQKAVSSKQIIKDKTLLAHGEKSRQAPTEGEEDKSAAPPAKKTKGQDYPPEFEALWQAYPRRQGSNPKNKAFACWSARRRDGVAPATMLAGVERYRNFCQLSEKSGTEFVLQAQTFLGPRREFENSWEITTGGNHVEFRFNQSDPRPYSEQYLEWEQRWQPPGATSMGPLGADVQDLRPPLECEEWQSSFGPLGGAGEFDDE